MRVTAAAVPVALAAWLATGIAAPAAAAGPASGRWIFKVSLDGKPIGQHRFDLTRQGDERELLSRADFQVRLLGIPAYRYRHRATERWSGDCLSRIDAETDDDGTKSQVEGRLSDGALQVQRGGARERLSACTMSYAYWHPGLIRQSRLLNAQTGAYDDVRFEVLGTDERGRHVRIHGPEQPVDLWYGPDGDWLALESRVSGGRRTLRYERVTGAGTTD